MPVYVVMGQQIPDPGLLADYRERNAPLIASHGGRILVRGGAQERFEGTWGPERIVILEFPDRAAALAWYDSAEYAPLKALRHRHAQTDMIIVDGIAPPA